jgi:DNA-binding Xre family transcriptional regulator
MIGRKKSFGTSFDDFLAEQGLLEEATVEATKRVVAWQIADEMARRSISKSEMARRMRTSRAALERLLDPANSSVTLKTLFKAAAVLGKQLSLELVG